MTPQEQARVFLTMMLCGACLGVLYDLLGMLRRTAFLCALTDVFFGLCCAVSVVAAALWLRCEAFRLYTFAGVGCGMALYGVSLGNIWRRIAHNVRQRIQKREEKYKNSQSPAGI